jgi:hypothetical protein
LRRECDKTEDGGSIVCEEVSSLWNCCVQGSVEFLVTRDLEVNKLRYLVIWQTIEC